MRAKEKEAMAKALAKEKDVGAKVLANLTNPG